MRLAPGGELGRIEILRGVPADNGLGDTVLTWAEPPVVPRVVDGCAVEPGASLENYVQGDSTLIAWTVFCPAGTDVDARDRIRYRGTVYTIYGEPLPWAGVTRRLDHLVLLLKTWRG